MVKCLSGSEFDLISRASLRRIYGGGGGGLIIPYPISFWPKDPVSYLFWVFVPQLLCSKSRNLLFKDSASLKFFPQISRIPILVIFLP